MTSRRTADNRGGAATRGWWCGGGSSINAQRDDHKNPERANGRSKKKQRCIIGFVECQKLKLDINERFMDEFIIRGRVGGSESRVRASG